MISCCSTRPRSSAAAPRKRPPLRSRQCLRLRLLQEPLALVLGNEAAPTVVRPRRHPTRCDTRLRGSLRARGRLGLLARTLNGGGTIGCDKGYAGREFEQAVSETRRPDRATRPQGRARQQRSAGADPATNRIGLPHLQRPPQPRTPLSPHHPQPPGADRDPPPRARRLHPTQPPTRPTQPSHRQLQRLTRWHQSPRGLCWTLAQASSLEPD